jgi:hypothetical protein
MRVFGSLLLLAGIVLGLYFAVAFDVTQTRYPSLPTDDPGAERARDETYGRIVSLAKLSDRNAGLTVGLALGVAGLVLVAQRRERRS